MAADGQISLRSICPARHPEGGNPCLACAMAGFFKKVLETALYIDKKFK